MTLNTTVSSNVYIARDWIEIQSGFSFTPSAPTPLMKKIVELKWNYSNPGGGWWPFLTINSQSIYGSSLPYEYNFDNFIETIEDLKSNLIDALGATNGWTFSVMPYGNSQYVTLRLEHASNYILGSYKNYNDTLLVQGYAPATDGNFEAKIDEGLVYDIEYLTAQPNPDRELNKSLPVGSIPGTFDVTPTGAATYTIPIDVPPGTSGMQPSVSITYNSQPVMVLLSWMEL